MSISKYMSGACIAECMDEVRELCSATNSVRSRCEIRTRQPIANMDIVSMNGKFSYLAFMPDMVQIIKDECNVKQLTIIDEVSGVFVV